MRVWGKIKLPQSPAASVARRALEGGSRASLVREAVRELLESGHADRVGVWIESEREVSQSAKSSLSGLVAEPEVAALPSEWSKLSTEPPLPVEVMSGLRGVEQELLPEARKPLIGPLKEMRRVLWIPVETRGRLRGVVFAGQRNKAAKLPWQVARSVAAELGLALELEDQRRKNEAHRASNVAIRNLLGTLGSGKSASETLDEIVAECTRVEPSGGPALTAFAAIGRAKRPSQGAKLVSAEDIEFLWHSGEPAWTRGLEEEPLQTLWRSAIETRRVVGTELGTRRGQDEISRIVAIPLEAGGEALGVFIAGIREPSNSLAALESMELRAALAADILLRERMEATHRIHELREEALLVAARAVAVDLDEHGRVLRTGIAEKHNQSMRAFPTSTPSAESEAAFTELFAADSAAAVGNWLQESKEYGTNDILDEARLRTGGQVRLRLLPKSENDQRTVLLEALDSDARKIDRSAVTELHSVIEWLEEGVVLLGANREIRAINSRFAQIMGLTPGELEEIRNFTGLLNALTSRLSNTGSLSQRWRGLGGSTEGAVREELRIERPIPRLVERVAHPILDATGALLGRVEIFRDLTAQRLFQSKLVQTGKLAELGQKVTAIAHELSNPLTSIVGYAQRTLRRVESRNDFREARQIFQEAERASTILRQLLLSARESRPQRRRVALNQLISRTTELNSHLATDNVRIELDLEPSLPLVKGDEGQLQQVLQNLISNARQALVGQREGATIRLTTRRLSENRVLLEVADNGPGIPQGIQSRIFDPFFTTKPAGEGTGLGLSIVAGIVREHGGQVRVESLPGRGSVFSIELPAITALEIQPTRGAASRNRSQEENLATLEPPAPAPSEASLGRWAGARVLVLEDEPTVARLIADVLEDEGLSVDTLLDSREALSQAASYDYAVVICDMKMPQVDGEEFYLALLRKQSPLRARVLFVTGDVLSAHTRNFLERYDLPYVAKPFRVEELTGKIRGVLERGKPIETDGDPLRKNAASK